MRSSDSPGHPGYRPSQPGASDRGSTRPPEVVPLTEVWRGDVIESRHRGAIALVDASGRLIHAVGDSELRTFWRSSSKPLQALPVVTTGAADRFGLASRHLAVMCGSHTGKDYHVDAVADILDRAGVPVEALRCDRPGQPLLQNGCSGKHAGMLATAAHLGEPLDGYTEPSHPVQRRIRSTLALLAETRPPEIPIASDGCSVPTFAMTLRQMALAFSRLVDPADLPLDLTDGCRRIVNAMQAHPELLSGAPGDTRDLTSALVALKAPLLIGKSGAEALFCVGIAPGVLGRRGVGIAVRAEDGGNVERSCYPATVEALRQLSLLDEAEVSRLEPFLGRVIRNVHGEAIGGARPCFRLAVAEAFG